MNEFSVTFTEKEMAKLLPVEVDTGDVGPKEVAGHTLATLISAGTEINSGYLGDNFPKGSGYAAVFQGEQEAAKSKAVQSVTWSLLQAITPRTSTNPLFKSFPYPKASAPNRQSLLV